MSIKSALRDLLSVSYGLIGILVISRYAAPPYPAAPDFLHGKAYHTILRSLCSLTNRVPLPPHPGDRINRSMLSCRDMAPLLSTHSPTAPRGEDGGASHQREKTPKWYVRYMTRCFFPSYLSFPLEGKSREAGKGVRGRAPIGCSIAVLTANRRPPERSDAQNVVSRFPFRGQCF